VLHAVLLVPGPQDAHWHTYVHVCVPTGMLCVGTRSFPWRIFCRHSFLCMLSKRETCVLEIRDAHYVDVSPFFIDMRRVLRGCVSLFLHQKLNYCQIQFSVHQKLNTRPQKLHTLQNRTKSSIAIFSHIEHISHKYPIKVIFSHIDHISHKYPLKVNFSHK
jgi:hypothetical protein